MQQKQKDKSVLVEALEGSAAQILGQVVVAPHAFSLRPNESSVGRSCLLNRAESKYVLSTIPSKVGLIGMVLELW